MGTISLSVWILGLVGNLDFEIRILNMSQQQPQDQPLQLKASEQVLKGVYSNLVNVIHTGEEFILDFVQIAPPGGNLVSRVFISPSHAKRILSALQKNIEDYEAEYGTISLAVVPDHKIGFKTE